MRDVRVSEATGSVLDWMVARCEGWDSYDVHSNGQLELERISDGGHCWLRCFTPSTDWLQGGPIIEREGINLNFMQFDSPQYWTAHIRHSGKVRFGAVGPTLLVASMRCYAASNLGDIVEVPEGANHGA